jgi:hypothetical protein
MKKELDIVFNIDYPSADSVGPLHDDLPKYVEYICVNDMSQFRRLISTLKETVVCFIWVHPSLNSNRVEKGLKSKVEIDTIPELDELQIQYKKITRSSQKSNNKDIFDANAMLEFKKGMKNYTVGELQKILFPLLSYQQNNVIRHRLKDSLSVDVANANSRLSDIRRYLAQIWESNGEEMWYANLIPSLNVELQLFFNSRYWSFPIRPLKRFLSLSNLGEDLLDKSVIEVPGIIVFDDVKMKWQIDLSFFDEVSSRFESIGQDNYREKLMIATCLYVIHEAVHKIHNLDNNTVQNIGNFPRIVEEADYQADAIAVTIELCFFMATSKGIDSLTVREIGEKLCEIIKIAIETTFSFNPVSEPLNIIQVRRVNRYLIWFWQYFKIQSLMKSIESPAEFVKQIFLLFNVKPNVEITGPAIISNENSDRTFYDLNDIKHKELLGIMLQNNQIIRLAPTDNLDFQNFYSSMKESNFDKMLEFLNRILSNYRANLDFEL